MLVSEPQSLRGIIDYSVVWILGFSDVCFVGVSRALRVRTVSRIVTSALLSEIPSASHPTVHRFSVLEFNCVRFTVVCLTPTLPRIPRPTAQMFSSCMALNSLTKIQSPLLNAPLSLLCRRVYCETSRDTVSETTMPSTNFNLSGMNSLQSSTST